MDKTPVNKDDYLQWREHPVSEAFLAETIEAMDEQLKRLMEDAGKDPITDRYRVGLIAGLRALADWIPMVVLEEKNEDDFESEGT